MICPFFLLSKAEICARSDIYIEGHFVFDVPNCLSYFRIFKIVTQTPLLTPAWEQVDMVGTRVGLVVYMLAKCLAISTISWETISVTIVAQIVGLV